MARGAKRSSKTGGTIPGEGHANAQRPLHASQASCGQTRSLQQLRCCLAERTSGHCLCDRCYQGHRGQRGHFLGATTATAATATTTAAVRVAAPLLTGLKRCSPYHCGACPGDHVGDDGLRLATTVGDDGLRLATTVGDDGLRLAATVGDDGLRLAATGCGWRRWATVGDDGLRRSISPGSTPPQSLLSCACWACRGRQAQDAQSLLNRRGPVETNARLRCPAEISV